MKDVGLQYLRHDLQRDELHRSVPPILVSGRGSLEVRCGVFYLNAERVPHFGLPVEIIAQPATWYAYHRTPRIVECAKDHTRVLVRFTVASLSGSFGGTRLYAQRDGSWDVYPIRPSESGSIASTQAWLVQRKWKAWYL